MTVAGFITGQRPERRVPHSVACRAPGVSESWFCKWRRRPGQPTKREVRRAALAERTARFFNAPERTYGSPRITLDLWAEGWQVSQNTVAEITAGLGLQGRKPPRRRKNLTRQGNHTARRLLYATDAQLALGHIDAAAHSVQQAVSLTGGLPVGPRLSIPTAIRTPQNRARHRALVVVPDHVREWLKLSLRQPEIR